ncbi:hypothetical protein BGX24_009921 [Mortierella sp. AD032]|nr:hypothetical protein BGX24_009921 [Mortierella sp. AD032]
MSNFINNNFPPQQQQQRLEDLNARFSLEQMPLQQHHPPTPTIRDPKTTTPTGRERKPPRNPKPKKQHACPECSRIFTRRCNLQSHRLTHTNLKPFPCPQCGQSFARIYDMRRHHRIHGQSEDDKPYKCPICPMAFRRIEPRVRHLLAAHGYPVGTKAGDIALAANDAAVAAAALASMGDSPSSLSSGLRQPLHSEDYDDDEEEEGEDGDVDMEVKKKCPLPSDEKMEVEHSQDQAPFYQQHRQADETNLKEEQQPDHPQSIKIEQQL